MTCISASPLEEPGRGSEAKGTKMLDVGSREISPTLNMRIKVHTGVSTRAVGLSFLENISSRDKASLGIRVFQRDPHYKN